MKVLITLELKVRDDTFVPYIKEIMQRDIRDAILEDVMLGQYVEEVLPMGITLFRKGANEE